MKKSLVFAGFGALLLVVVLYGAVKLGEAPTLNMGESDAVYRVEEYGITLTVPEGYVAREMVRSEEDKYVLVLMRSVDLPAPEGGEGPPAITLEVFEGRAGTDLKSWIENAREINIGPRTSELEPASLGDEDGFFYTWDGLYPGRSIAVSYGDDIVVLSGTYLSREDEIFDDFYTVAESVRFE